MGLKGPDGRITDGSERDMECTTFLEGYSDLRDERLPPDEAARFRTHLQGCAACARYDRTLRRGAEILCALDEMRPADDFMFRLQCRIYQEEADARRLPTSSRAAVPVAAALAAALVLGAWIPALRNPTEPQRLPAAVARLDQGEAALWLSAPLLTHTAMFHREGMEMDAEYSHSLFSFFPTGAPVAARLASLEY